jgi:hypothetical protein
MTPFNVRIPQTAIDNLKTRLDSVRWPDREPAAGQGVPLKMAQALASRWRNEYDWRKFEERINR